MDDLVDPAADLAPLAVPQVDAAALDLDDRDADAGPGDDDVSLAIFVAVAEALTADEDDVVRQVVLQRLDEQPFGSRGELRRLREPARGHRRSPTFMSPDMPLPVIPVVTRSIALTTDR